MGPIDAYPSVETRFQNGHRMEFASPRSSCDTVRIHLVVRVVPEVLSRGQWAREPVAQAHQIDRDARRRDKRHTPFGYRLPLQSHLDGIDNTADRDGARRGQNR